jgi:hypothetical protein
MYIVTLTKKIAGEWRKRRNTVKCTSHGDSVLYTTCHNTIRWILEMCTEKACVNTHIHGICNNRIELTNLIQFNLISSNLTTKLIGREK